jgi:hypothetical protein
MEDTSMVAANWQPLYKCLGLNGYLVRYRAVASNTVDLETITRNMLNVNEHQKRLEAVLCYHAVGRGGEHYLLRWDECHWDPRFRCPDFTWPLLKQISYQSMAFVPEKFRALSFLTDIYHCFGCYFALADGLFNGQYHEAKRKYVFPAMHERNRERVASDLTASMRKHMPSQLSKTEGTIFHKVFAEGRINGYVCSHRYLCRRAHRTRGLDDQCKNANGYVDSNVTVHNLYTSI